MYTNIIHNDDICNYFLKNQQFIFNSLGNCRECRFNGHISPLLTEHPVIQACFIRCSQAYTVRKRVYHIRNLFSRTQLIAMLKKSKNVRYSAKIASNMSILAEYRLFQIIFSNLSLLPG